MNSVAIRPARKPGRSRTPSTIPIRGNRNRTVGWLSSKIIIKLTKAAQYAQTGAADENNTSSAKQSRNDLAGSSAAPRGPASPQISALQPLSFISLFTNNLPFFSTCLRSHRIILRAGLQNRRSMQISTCSSDAHSPFRLQSLCECCPESA